MENEKYVICKICGKRGRNLSLHIKKKHNLTKHEYEEKYKSSVICGELHKSMSDRGKEWNKRLNSDPELSEKCKKARQQAIKLPQVRSAQRDYMRKWLNSKEGKEWNRKNMKYTKQLYGGEEAFQALATEGKKQSKLFHDVHSKIATELMVKLHQNKEWEKQLVKKAFDGSKKSYIDIEGNEVYLRSSYELTLHNYLISNKITHSYESVQISYTLDSGKVHTYIPDFYLPEKNILLEVKPKTYVNNKINQIKHNASIEAGFIHLFVTEKQLKDLNSFFYNVINKIGS